MTTSSQSPVELNAKVCGRGNLTLIPSLHAAESGYKQPLHRVAATKPQKSSYETRLPYPAPLILPGDEPALDPTYPLQSVRS